MGLGTYMAGAAIGSAAKSFIDNGINALFGDITTRRNYKYNEMAAKNADTRTRALYTDLYGPSAKLQQLKDAGLSPSLFYDSAGIGGAGQAGTQSAGAAGIAPPYSNGVSPTEIANADLMNSQARLNNAQADEIEGINERGAAEIERILAEAGLKNAETAYKESQAEKEKLEVYVLSKTKDFKISEAKAISEKAAYSAMKTMYETLREMKHLEFDSKTLEERVRNVQLTNENLTSDLITKALQRDFTNTEIMQINAEIQKWYIEAQQGMIQVGINMQNANTQYQFMKNINEYWNGQVEQLEKRLNFDKDKWSEEKEIRWTEAIGTLSNNAVGNFTDILKEVAPMLNKRKPIGFGRVTPM